MSILSLKQLNQCWYSTEYLPPVGSKNDMFNFQSVSTETVLARTNGSGGGGNNKNKK
jgi:hypothetical protein